MSPAILSREKPSMSRVFNGTSDYLRHSAAVATAYPFSFAGWAKYTTEDTAAMFVGVYDGSVLTKRFTLGKIATNRSALYTRDTTEWLVNTPTVVAAVDTWFHYAGVWTAENDRILYVNGTANKVTSSASTAAYPALTTPRTSIGGDDVSSFVRGWPGKVAHVAIWNTTLSDANVNALYNGGTGGGANPLTVAAANLLAYWPLNTAGATEPDSKGSFDMTVSGATSDTGDNPTVDAPPSSGLSIAVAMHHYRQMMSS